MRRFPVVAGNDQVNVFRQLRVGAPSKLEKFFNLVRMLFAKFLGEKRAGIAELFAQRFLETFLDKANDEPVGQAGYAVWPRPRRLTGTAGSHDETFYPPRKV